jgi:hypothetical protein
MGKKGRVVSKEPVQVERVRDMAKPHTRGQMRSGGKGGDNRGARCGKTAGASRSWQGHHSR